MEPKLRPLEEQVVVITGASSGIGLAAARAFVGRGAAVVLAARSGDAIEEEAARIRSHGGRAAAVVCDVSERAQVERLASEAERLFGGVDTWVNNAGVSVYGKLEEVSEEDCRRVFDVNFWGTYYGCLAALPLLRRRGGGALVNVGSEVSDAVVPLQGIYSASKHALKGLNDALRVEVTEVDEAPVSVTLVQPTAVDTPYPHHAKNYTGREPKLPSPQVSADKVAEAVVDAAVNPTRYARVGAGAKVNTVLAKILPAVADKLSGAQADRQQYDEPPRNPAGALYRPSAETGYVGTTDGPGGAER